MHSVHRYSERSKSTNSSFVKSAKNYILRRSAVVIDDQKVRCYVKLTEAWRVELCATFHVVSPRDRADGEENEF